MITIHTNFNNFIAKYKKHAIVLSYYKDPSLYTDESKSIIFVDNLQTIELLDPFPNELKYSVELCLKVGKKMYNPIHIMITKTWSNRNGVGKLNKDLYSNKKGDNKLTITKVSFIDLNLAILPIYDHIGKSMITSIMFTKKNRGLFIDYVNKYNRKAVTNYIDIISIVPYSIYNKNLGALCYIEIYYQYIFIDSNDINRLTNSTKSITDDNSLDINDLSEDDESSNLLIDI